METNLLKFGIRKKKYDFSILTNQVYFLIIEKDRAEMFQHVPNIVACCTSGGIRVVYGSLVAHATERTRYNKMLRLPLQRTCRRIMKMNVDENVRLFLPPPKKKW